MRFREDYINCKLAGVPYLLPYGQSITDYTAGLQVNDTGARLWEAIRRGADRDDLLAMLADESEAKTDEIPELEQDLNDFLSLLTGHRLLLPETPASSFAEYFAQIGPLCISLRIPDALREQYFSDFVCCPAENDRIHQQVSVYPHPPFSHPNGQVLIRTKELIILETEALYIFLPLEDSPVTEMHVTKNGKQAAIYCRTSLEADDMEGLFHAIRFAFVVVAAQHDLYVVHSASLLYEGKAWLFSGPSGTGKSTHTNLWKDAFDTPLLNGDLNMVGLENGIPMCYGLPWCGTSGIHTPKNYPLGGITFLKKHPTNKVEVPSADQKVLYLLQRLISPTWTAAQLTQCITFCELLTSAIPMFRLYCTKEPQAPHTMREAIVASPGAVPFN